MDRHAAWDLEGALNRADGVAVRRGRMRGLPAPQVDGVVDQKLDRELVAGPDEQPSQLGLERVRPRREHQRLVGRPNGRQPTFFVPAELRLPERTVGFLGMDVPLQRVAADPGPATQLAARRLPQRDRFGQVRSRIRVAVQPPLEIARQRVATGAEPAPALALEFLHAHEVVRSRIGARAPARFAVDRLGMHSRRAWRCRSDQAAAATCGARIVSRTQAVSSWLSRRKSRRAWDMGPWPVTTARSSSQSGSA